MKMTKFSAKSQCSNNRFNIKHCYIWLTISCNCIALKNRTIRSLEDRNLQSSAQITFWTIVESLLRYKYSYLPNGVHLEKLRGFVGDTHLKVLHQLNLDTAVFRGNKSLECIFVTTASMQYLHTQKVGYIQIKNQHPNMRTSGKMKVKQQTQSCRIKLDNQKNYIQRQLIRIQTCY